jgi:hypothetical protein
LVAVVHYGTARKRDHSVWLALNNHRLIADGSGARAEPFPVRDVPFAHDTAGACPIDRQTIGTRGTALNDRSDVVLLVQVIEHPIDRVAVAVIPPAADQDPQISPFCWRCHSTLPG